ncbi:hypothetical protein BV898_07813 [Hypsibius exemplaris]|uniref:Peptidase S1 domain-containing protein n=1 Tax=Hypsibius exemplaris TaxID=2072580 RepID=A0A1W0WSQ3_HYPEX|nr:hypothetical protein BV898_07813 [Hypsibius exemplaris]
MSINNDQGIIGTSTTTSVNYTAMRHGTHRNKRFVAGKTVGRNQFTFVVSLQYPNGQGFCGGSLISARHIITASHCVQDGDGTHKDVNRIRVGVGLHDQGSGNASNYLTVATIDVHPGYLSTPISSDIGILTLSNSIAKGLRGMVSRIALPSSERINPKPGTLLTSLGWGRMENRAIYAWFPVTTVDRSLYP